MTLMASNKTLSRLFLFFSALVLIVWGCKKQNFNDALPVVAMQSVTMVNNDSAEIAGVVTDPGADPVQYEGFCYGGDSKPSIFENQVFAANNSKKFKIRVAVKQDSTYFFRCFAANGFSYSLSMPLKFMVPHAQPAIAPCTLTNMRFTAGNINYTIDGVYTDPQPGWGSWGIEADYAGGNAALRMDFNKIPTNGVYVTNGDPVQFNDNKNPHEVFAEITDFNTIGIHSGDSVYVSENPDKSLTVSFCNLHYDAGSSTATASGKFMVK
jgi:hypothetical protein